jgi:uncharacterized membrane protein
MPAHVTLAVAALIWFAIHKVVAGSGLRGVLVAKLGNGPYRGLFALLSLGSLSFLIYAYRKAPCDPLWTSPHFVYWLPLVMVPIAFVFVAGAFTVPNPTTVAGERALSRADPARGMLRITRHPFLWGVMLWSATHLIVNGNVAALLLFSSMLATAAAGTRDIDRKRAASEGERWSRYAAVTSNLPFAAIVSGRNRLALGELVLPVILGALLAAVTLHYHASFFGMSAFRALR